MRLQTLQLHNFRNYQNLNLSFDAESNVVALVGQNGQGKTNLVEAISLLALTKSFRSADATDITAWGEEYFRMSAVYTNEDDERQELTIVSQDQPRRQRKLMVNGVQKSATDFIGHLAVTLFHADDIYLLFSAPAERRRYLDTVLSQVSRTYLLDLMAYQKTVKQRNQLLKRIKQRLAGLDELLFWDEQCVMLGLKITKKRRELVDFFNAHLNDLYRSLSNEAAYDIAINYHPKMGQQSKEEALEAMKQRYDRDVIMESSSMGPHRDDWLFEVNTRAFASFGSRGEMRSMILALKLVEREYFKIQKGTYPILLLDDVFSELDDSRKQLLIATIQDQQTFITTTDTACLRDLDGRVKVWEVTRGVVQSLKRKA